MSPFSLVLVLVLVGWWTGKLIGFCCSYRSCSCGRTGILEGVDSLRIHHCRCKTIPTVDRMLTKELLVSRFDLFFVSFIPLKP